MRISRREAMTFLLGGLAALGGITSSSEKPSIPERCKRQRAPKALPADIRWESFPYASVGLDQVLLERARAREVYVPVVGILPKQDKTFL